VRRGSIAQGSSWQRSGPVPWPLLRFSVKALRDLRMFRAHMDEPAWARDPPLRTG
jgi:hypothetical protein